MLLSVNVKLTPIDFQHSEDKYRLQSQVATMAIYDESVPSLHFIRSIQLLDTRCGTVDRNYIHSFCLVCI